MFTGLVEATGRVISLEKTGESAHLVLDASKLGSDVQIGESVAVNGCCLTATAVGNGLLEFDLLAETLRRTNLDLAPGRCVNLERAVLPTTRLGGHFVQGHVDCTSEILAFEPAGSDYKLEIALPAEFKHYVAYKGSISVDGISLTVAEVKEASFVIWIIPHTFEVTNLHEHKAGELVNLEFDMLAKYVERIMATR